MHDSFIIAREHEVKLVELMIESFCKEVPVALPGMTNSINPFLEGYVPWTDFSSGVLTKDDPASKESRKLKRRLKEHQSINWPKDYYHMENT